MVGEHEYQHLLVMIETAQRAGREEREIVAIVDEYFGAEARRDCGIGEPGFLRRLVARGRRVRGRAGNPLRSAGSGSY
jgi:hypothetical protein